MGGAVREDIYTVEAGRVIPGNDARYPMTRPLWPFIRNRLKVHENPTRIQSLSKSNHTVLVLKFIHPSMREVLNSKEHRSEGMNFQAAVVAVNLSYTS